MESPVFVEEIDLRELQFLEMVGRGSFGIVKHARWGDIEVAVKLIETEQERKAFITELKQLSRVNHPNIVKLYGACTNQPVCLVMEYAEGGSLYNVLHRSEGPKLPYNSSQAMNWMLQCALGVEYLHGMKPKPLIHRDLKPPNLLLQAGGTVLKICDFGTACDAHTHMTNNKGSAAWMAPEVFEGCRYSEKCDVYSWGIILWEVLTRRKPFDEIGASAFRIMWQVHNGTRPPLIKNCPQCLEVLMKRCWSSNPVERPPMIEVVRIVKCLMQYFPGATEPLVYPQQTGDGTPGTPSSVYDTPPLSNVSQIGGPTLKETVRKGEAVPITPVTPKSKPLVVEDKSPRFGGRTSAPASLAASRENLLDGKGSRCSTPSIDFKNKRYSADLSKMGEELEHFVTGGQVQQKPPGRGHRRTGSYGNSPISSGDPVCIKPIMHVSTSPAILGGSITTPNHTTPTSMAPGTYGQSNAQRSISWNPDLTTGYPCVSQPPVPQQQIYYDGIIDHQLQPLPPSPSCPESVNIYVEHCKVVENYVKIMAEISWLKKRKECLQREQEMEEKEDVNSARSNEEFNSLVNENESLSLLHENLKKQFEQIKNKRQGLQ